MSIPIPPTKWSELPASFKQEVYVISPEGSGTPWTLPKGIVRVPGLFQYTKSYTYPIGILKEFRIFDEDLVPEDLTKNSYRFPIRVPFTKVQMDTLLMVVTEPERFVGGLEFSLQAKLNLMFDLEQWVTRKNIGSFHAEEAHDSIYLSLVLTRSGYRFLSEDCALQWTTRYLRQRFYEHLKVNPAPGNSVEKFEEVSELEIRKSHLKELKEPPEMPKDYSSWWCMSNLAIADCRLTDPYELEYLTRTGEVRTLDAEKIVDSHKACCCCACFERCWVEPETFVGPTAMTQLAESYSGKPEYLYLSRPLAIELWNLYHRSVDPPVGREKSSEGVSEGPSERLSEGPSERLSEGPSEQPSQGVPKEPLEGDK